MKRFVHVFAVLLLAWPCWAGQAPGPTPWVAPTGAGQGADQGILQELLKEMAEKKPVRSNEGIGPVPASQASLCPVCSQPLYKHTDPAFVCAPPDKKLLEIHSVPVQCPVCQAQFAAALPGNVPDKAPRDRDFCAHTIGKYAVHSKVWTCPDCGYANLIPADQKGEGFALGLDGKPLDQATKEFVRQRLSEPMRKLMIKQAGLKEEKPPAELLEFSKYVDQTLIPDWIKYDHALQICERLKAPHTLLARLYLEGAHACRREVYGEISAPYLDQMLLDSLGKAINRINRYVQADCLAMHRERHDPLVDPTKAETDARLLSQAIARIIRVGDEAMAQRRLVAAGNEQTYFTNADMFVLHLLEAGVLDRLGKTEEAGKALSKAIAYVPERPVMVLEDKGLEERVVRQLKLLRGVVEDRQMCLEREKQYLMKAAVHDMAAMRNNEIKFKECRSFDPKAAESKDWDAAPTSYLLGELLRRGGDADSAASWFAAADRIIEKNLQVVAAAEKAAPPVVLPPVLVGGREPVLSLFERERERLLVLRLWNREQNGLITGAKEANATVKAVIALVLQAVGLPPAESSTGVPPANEHGQDARATRESGTAILAVKDHGQDARATGEAVVQSSQSRQNPSAGAGGRIKTREQLFKLYYAAILRYRSDHKANPPSLKDLVTGGYVKAEESNLDESGKLLCPETQERLTYMRNWEPGDRTAPVLFPPRLASKTLYADGEIQEGLAGRKN